MPLITNPSVYLGRFGALTLTNFAFSFLKRVWRSGVDNDLCSDVLSDALATIRTLPPALLSHEGGVDLKRGGVVEEGGEVWSDVVAKTQDFLESVVLK